jgi:hypothetical protein
MSSKTTLNTDVLTIRKVFALSTNDAVIPALRCLTSDGYGGTYWATPAALGGSPAFNGVNINSNQINALGSSNTLSVITTNGITVSASNLGYTLIGQAFTQLAVDGTNTLVGYSNNTAKSTIRFVPGTGIQMTTDPLTNTLTFQAAPSSIGGGIYTFNKFETLKNLVRPTDKASFATTGVNQTISTIGSNDILISSDPGRNAIFIGISTFNSPEYLTISTLANYGYRSSLSSVKDLFVDNPLMIFSTQNTVNLISNISVGIKQQFDVTNVLISQKVAQSFFENFEEKYGQVTSTLKLGATSTFCFTSSLGLTDGFGIQASPPIADTLFISTHSFRLESMSNLLLSEGQTTIQWSPSFLIGATQQGATFPLLEISTFLIASNSVVSTTTFTRPWMAMNATTNSNLYTDTFTMRIDPRELSNSYTSTYKICHRILNYKHDTYPPTNSGFATSTLSTITSPRHALQVQITGKKFTIV